MVREPGTPATKGRPCIVVQRDSTLDDTSKITVCPLTSYLRGALGGRTLVAPSARNGLRKPCEVQFDWIYTHSAERIGGHIGSLEADILDQVDIALRRWLEL